MFCSKDSNVFKATTVPSGFPAASKPSLGDVKGDIAEETSPELAIIGSNSQPEAPS